LQAAGVQPSKRDVAILLVQQLGLLTARFIQFGIHARTLYTPLAVKFCLAMSNQIEVAGCACS
jgi:hypothetical protein